MKSVADTSPPCANCCAAKRNNHRETLSIVIKRHNSVALYILSIVKDMDGIHVSLNDHHVLIFRFEGHNRLNSDLMKTAFSCFEHDIAPHYTDDQKFPLLIDMPSMLSVSYGAARFTSSEAMIGRISAFAFVPHSTLQEHLVQQYEWYHNPPYPFRIFHSVEKAENWLSLFSNEFDSEDPRQPVVMVRDHQEH